MVRARSVVLLAAAALCIPVTAAATPIPSVPGAVPRFVGAPPTADPIESFTVPQNPHLTGNPYNSMHNDAYATDSYAGAGPPAASRKSTRRSTAWRSARR